MKLINKTLRVAGAVLLTSALAQAQSGRFTGTFQYMDMPYTATGFAATPVARPIRFARIQAVDQQTGLVVGVSTTDGLGNYNFTASGTFTSRPYFVRCLSATRGVPPNPGSTSPSPSYEVRSEATATTGRTLYALQTGALTSPSGTYNMGLATSQPMVITSQFAPSWGNPFNVLDVAVDFSAYVQKTGNASGSFGGTYTGPTGLFVFPSPAAGFISFAIDAVPAVIPPINNGFLEAHIDVTSGYDDPVIAHELGHLLHMRNNSAAILGALHFFGDSDQDPRLAFSEAVATFFGARSIFTAGPNASAAASVATAYLDTSPTQGPSPTIPGPAMVSLRFNAETAGNSNFFLPGNQDAQIGGAADELAILSSLWDIADRNSEYGGVGSDGDGVDATEFQNGGLANLPLPADAAISRVLFGGANGTANLNGTADVTFADFWHYFSTGSGLGVAPSTYVPQALTIIQSQAIQFANDAFEPNEDLATASYICSSGQWQGATLYREAYDQSTNVAGIGDVDVYRVSVNTPGPITAQTRYPADVNDAQTMCDPQIEVLDSSGVVLASDDNGVTAPVAGGNLNRNAVVTTNSLPVGTYYVRVSAAPFVQGTPPRPVGSYELSVIAPGFNQAPSVTASGPATFTHGGPTATSSTAVILGSDPEEGSALTYEWSAPDGGTFVPNGNSCSFTPPVSSAGPMGYKLRVRAIDSCGASSPNFDFHFTVYPDGGLEVGQLVTGQTTIIVASAEPGETVTLCYNTTGFLGPQTYTNYVGTWYMSQNPPNQVAATCDANGIARFPAAVDANPAYVGVTVYYQSFYTTSGPSIAGFGATDTSTIQ